MAAFFCLVARRVDESDCQTLAEESLLICVAAGMACCVHRFCLGTPLPQTCTLSGSRSERISIGFHLASFLPAQVSLPTLLPGSWLMLSSHRSKRSSPSMFHPAEVFSLAGRCKSHRAGSPVEAWRTPRREQTPPEGGMSWTYTCGNTTQPKA